MLRVRLLGGMALEADGRPLAAPSSRPARELLAWLALHPGAHPRLELAMRFWPDVLESSARASLRTTLHELRRALGPDGVRHLAVDRDRVGLAAVWTDAEEFRRLAGDGRPEEALALCTGELLAGLETDWAAAARDEHRDAVASLLAGLADAAPGAAGALRWARELVHRDPLSEDGTRRLMEALARTGDRPAAIAAYGRLADRLRRELAIPPSRPTRELLARIRAEDEEETGAAPERPPLPHPLAPRGGPLAGRAEELRRLVEAGSGVLLLAGEPGIGKTRLLAEAGRVRHERGATVLYGRCNEEQLTPYEPFAEALGLGDLAAAEGSRWRLFEGIAARLAPPTVLLLDDLHWADAGTLRLLAHLLRRPRPPAVLGAYRDSEISRSHPLAAVLADLRRDGLVERLPLGGLDGTAVAELVAARDAPPDLAGPLHRETGGNPFFVEEVLRHLADAGPPAQGALPIPEGVKDVIGRRLSRLAADTGRALSVAAVAGREFDVALLEAVLDGVDVLAAVEEAAAAAMLREDPAHPGRYAFSHALIRETLYDELSLTRRVRTHRTLADALAASPSPRAAELAHHRLEGAAAGDAPGAARTALAAATEAMRALAYEEAADFCE